MTSRASENPAVPHEPDGVRVLLFGILRERIGASELAVPLPDGAPAADLLRELARRHPGTAEVLRICRVAVNCAYAGPETAVRSGDEVAIIPPVSGG